jgi:hypothetical protein
VDEHEREALESSDGRGRSAAHDHDCRRRTPAEKKCIAYKRDHREAVEYPHSYRKKRPRRKKLAHKLERVWLRQSITSALQQASTSECDALDVPPKRRAMKRLHSHARAVPLGEWITNGFTVRLQHTARKTLGGSMLRGYVSKTHRARFAAFLAQLTQGHTDYTRALARLFDAALNPDCQPSAPTSDWRRAPVQGYGLRRWMTYHACLRAFFHDEPEWEPRLQRWVADQLQR